MARPEKLTDTVLREISKIRRVHPGWRPGEIQGQLRVFLLDQAKKEHPEWADQQRRDFVESKRLPGLSSISKAAADLKGHDSLLDRPWRLSTLPHHPIPPESLPSVLELFVEELRDEAIHITIREALWIGRLAFIYREKKKLLWQSALLYAEAERTAEATGQDITDLGDDFMVYGEMPGKPALLPADYEAIRNQENAAVGLRRVTAAGDRKRGTKTIR